jgi:hypothetical protein
VAERNRRPARYYEDGFIFTPGGRRVSELTDDELLAYDPSRAPTVDPPPPGPPPAESGS